MKKQLLSFFLVLITFGISAQSIVVNDPDDPETALSAEDLLRDVLINGSSCVDVTLTNLADNPDGAGDPNQRSWGYFRNGGGSFPFEEGIILSSGFAVNAQGPNDSTASSDGTGAWVGDIDIQTILDNFTGSNQLTNNATVFEFTFTSAIDQVNFEFIFASEEYEDQFECDDAFRDGFAFLVSGPGIPDDSGAPFGGTNIASIVGSDNVPVNTLSIHADTFPICGTEIEGVNFFPELYVSNQGANNNDEIQFDGRTVELTTATVDVIPDEIYTVKLVIADRGDSGFDSAVFLNAGSFDIGQVSLGDDLLIASGNAACEGDIVTLDATTENATSYTWFLNGTVIPNEINPTLDITEAGTYSVEIGIDLGNGEICVLSDEIIVEFAPVPPIVTPEDLIVCDDLGDGVEVFDLTSQITTILDGLDPAQFEVSFHTTQLDAEAGTSPIATPDAYANVGNPETIYVRVQGGDDGSDCFSVVNFDLILNEIIDLTNNLPTSLDVCSNDSFPSLDATPTNAGIDLSQVSYLWTDASGNTVSTDAVFTPTQSGTLTVVVDLPPCSQNTFTVDVLITDPPIVDLGPDELICDGDAFEIIPALDGNLDEATFLWSTGETTESIVVDQSGTFTLTVTVGPCSVSDDIVVTIADPVDVSIRENFTTCRDFEETFTATTDTPGATFEWFIEGVAQGETSSTFTTSFPTGTPSGQEVTVVVTNPEGCTGEASTIVSFFEIDQCVIPEGISPGTTIGFNDRLDLEFLAERTGIETIYIYNRLGTLVFEQDNYVNQWEGQSDDGDTLPTATYFYVIDFEGNDPVYGNQATGWVYVNR